MPFRSPSFPTYSALLAAILLPACMSVTRSEYTHATYLDGTVVKTETVNGQTTTWVTTPDGEVISGDAIKHRVRDHYEAGFADGKFTRIEIEYSGNYTVVSSPDADLHFSADAVAFTGKSLDTFKKNARPKINGGELSIQLSRNPMAGLVSCDVSLGMLTETLCLENVVIAVPAQSKTVIRVGGRAIHRPASQ